MLKPDWDKFFGRISQAMLILAIIGTGLLAPISIDSLAQHDYYMYGMLVMIVAIATIALLLYVVGLIERYIKGLRD